MPVILDGKKIIPAPLTNISREVVRSEDGTLRRTNFVITLTGKVLAEKGSPRTDGSFFTASGYPADEIVTADARLAAFRNKIGALTALCSIEHKLLEIQPYDGTAPIKGVVRLRSINFAEGQWYDYVNYSIVFEADKLFFGSIEIPAATEAIMPEESWSVEQADDKGKTYRIQHTLSMTAKAEYNIETQELKPGWKVARDKILAQAPVVGAPFLGLDNEIFQAPNAASVVMENMVGYNYARGQQIDEAGGKYVVTESWLMYNPALTGGKACLEEYNVTVRIAEDGRTRVNIDGTLTGLEVRNNTTQALTSNRWANVLSRWDELEPQLMGICAANAGDITLNAIPLSNTVGKNQGNGVITFSREYDNRTDVVPGALSGSIQVSDSKPTSVYASMVILGKPEGPLLQSIGTVTASKRSLNIELAMPAATMANPTPSQPNVDSIVDGYAPEGAFKDRDEENWSIHSGRYTRNVAWTWV